MSIPIPFDKAAIDEYIGGDTLHLYNCNVCEDGTYVLFVGKRCGICGMGPPVPVKKRTRPPNKQQIEDRIETEVRKRLEIEVKKKIEELFVPKLVLIYWKSH